MTALHAQDFESAKLDSSTYTRRTPVCTEPPRLTKSANRSVTEEELKAFCRGALADYKIPRHIQPVAELPLTGAGKLDRHAVVALFSSSLTT